MEYSSLFVRDFFLKRIIINARLFLVPLPHQQLLIEGSNDVEVTTSDTDVAVSIQVLLQILIALVAQLDIL
ncbi:spore coat protein [Virgibacillus sp. LDC-1]|uniref:spore coat protein n=1 Tax=Virgibacillus sp. LDC-1 TaxID=3039856 RepID=UPI0032E7FCF3